MHLSVDVITYGGSWTLRMTYQTDEDHISSSNFDLSKRIRRQ